MALVSTPMRAVFALVCACSVWGLSGIYYKAIAHVPPLEVLSHRTLWSMVFFGLVLLVQGRAGQVRATFANYKTLARLAVAAVVIAMNWGGFILSIQMGWALEASLGYYIFPLVSVAIGYFVFGERFRTKQAIAITIAAIAVLVLTIGLGAAPWMALMLATTFGAYGMIKKQLDLGPVISVFFETLLLAPLAIIWLLGAYLNDWSLVGRSAGVFGTNWQDSLLLAFSGIMTGGPLVLFSYAARRLTLTSVGLIQYLNPTLQFAIAALIFAEPVTLWHSIAFPLIWAGLALYTWDNWRTERRRVAKSPTVPTN
ncbi:MAG: EamA family transporter RarD [Paracoccaceae bacterium]